MEKENFDIRESGVVFLYEVVVEVIWIFDFEVFCDVNNIDVKYDVVKIYDVSSKCELL